MSTTKNTSIRPEECSKPFVVAQIVPSMDSGGVERDTLEVAVAVQKEPGFRSVVISGGGRMVKELERAGVKHVTLPVGAKNPLVFFRARRRLEKLVREEGIDLLHARSRIPAWQACKVSKSAGVPFVASFHGMYGLGPFGIKKPYNRAMTKGKLVLAVSEFIRDYIRTHYKVDEARLRVVLDGVDVRRFDPARVSESRRIQAIKRLGVPEDIPLILLPARFTRLKGHLLVLEALAGLKARNVPFGALFLGEAKKSKEAYFEEVRKAVRDRGLESHVFLRRDGAEIDAAYMISTIVLNASTHPESFGLTLVEAAAMRRLVVGPRFGGTAETVVDGRTGFLFEPNDPKDLARVLEEALTLPPAQAENMAAAAQERARTCFSLEKMNAATLEIYREVLTCS